MRVGVVKTFLLPSYGFSFGYKRKGVSIAEVTEAQSNIVGQKMRVNAFTGRRYNPSVFSACKTSRKASSPYTGEPRRLRRRARRLSQRGQGSRERVQFASVAIPYQNVCARRTHINILPQSGKIFHTRKARISPRQRRDFTRCRGTRRRISLRRRAALCAVILSLPPAQSGSGDTGKADRAAVKIPPSTPPAEQSPCRKTEQARCNRRSQK